MQWTPSLCRLQKGKMRSLPDCAVSGFATWASGICLSTAGSAWGTVAKATAPKNRLVRTRIFNSVIPWIVDSKACDAAQSLFLQGYSACCIFCKSRGENTVFTTSAATSLGLQTWQYCVCCIIFENGRLFPCGCAMMYVATSHSSVLCSISYSLDERLRYITTLEQKRLHRNLRAVFEGVFHRFWVGILEFAAGRKATTKYRNAKF